MFRSLRRSALVTGNSPCHSSRYGRRHVRLESLEWRCVLSTLDPCLAESPPAIVATESTETTEPMGPLELDSYYASLGSSEAATLPAAEGEEPSASPTIPPTAPPTIVEFNVRRVESYWIITGRVTDDYSMAGMSVFFGQYLNGQHATIQADGSFTHYAYAPPGVTADVTAVAIDLHGNQSAEVSAILPA